MPGKRFPANRLGRGFTGPGLFENVGFRTGWIELDANGGQVPWHNHEQNEVYVMLEGDDIELAMEDEGTVRLRKGQAVHIPSGKFHQLTNRGPEKAVFLYIYEGDGDVDHWRQELDGTLPKAGVTTPPLPGDAYRQCPESTKNSPSA
ncbi:MAG: cupin domain-containing protein [bacterium]|nr:cupin domain-containing protein [bacterium]